MYQDWRIKNYLMGVLYLSMFTKQLKKKIGSRGQPNYLFVLLTVSEARADEIPALPLRSRTELFIYFRLRSTAFLFGPSQFTSSY